MPSCSPLLLVCLPWQPFMTQALQSGWLWWPYALTRMVDFAGAGLHHRRPAAADPTQADAGRSALLALAGALFAVLASDWLIKSLIKLLTEEPRPYLLWLESQADPRHPPVLCRQVGSQRTGPRRDPVAGAARLARPPLAGRGELRLPLRPQHRRHEPGPVLRPDLAGARPAGAWLLPLWAIGVGLSRTLIGMHWPLDVLASALLGSLTALFAVRWWLRHY
jgi:phosphatidylglycerophosphatase B